jgi:formylglycine-generating enzyme
MDSLRYQWFDGATAFELVLAPVPGTGKVPFQFGEAAQSIAITVPDFLCCTTSVTQALWRHITGTDSPALHRGAQLPVENVSWDALTAPTGFLQQLNASQMADSMREQAGAPLVFRLPTETEWEYAARGGPHWRDGFRYSGSNDIAAVAWYDRRHGDWTQPVATRAPNQLGLFDLSGNVWEWCADTYTPDTQHIPRDGSAYRGAGAERVLRGGCFHNWAAHCTVLKRYESMRDAHDGCIGFRLVATTGA